MRPFTIAALIGLLGFLAGHADADTTADQVVGWRGNWTGHFPQAEPPLHWERRAKILLSEMRALASRPDNNAAAGTPMMPGSNEVPEWLVLGPLPCKTIDEPLLNNETTVQPREGDRVGNQTWERMACRDLMGQWGKILYPSSDEKQPNQAIYLATNLYAPQAGAIGMYVVGHSKGAKIWLNGNVVHRSIDKRDHGHAPIPIKVSRGWNRLLIKLNSLEGGYHLLFHLGPLAAPYSFTSKNFKWTTHLPSRSHATPVVVGERVFVMAEPDSLLCVDKHTGKILWLRSHGHYECARGELDKSPDGAALKKTWAQVESLQARMIAELNAAVAPGGAPAGLPVIKPATLAAKTQAEQALDKLAAPHLDAEARDRRQKMIKAWELSTQGGWAVATPCSDGERVYAWFQQGVAVCYDLDGKLQWLKTVPFSGDTHHGYTASPVLSGGKFIVGPRRVIAFNTKDGSIAWENKQRVNTWGSMVALKIGRDDVVLSGDGTFFRVADGKQLWQASNFGNSKLSTAICDQGVIYDFMSSNKLVSMELPRSLQGQPRWRYRLDNDFPTLPSRSHSSGLVASPLHHEGLLYLLSCGGYLQVHEAATGKLVYQQKLDMNPRVDYTGNPGCTASPALAGKYIYLFDNSGVTIVIEPGRQFKQVARNVIDNHGEQLWTCPIFDGKHLYLRTPEHLYCIGG